MAIGFTQYNRRLGSTATGTQGARRPAQSSGSSSTERPVGSTYVDALGNTRTVEAPPLATYSVPTGGTDALGNPEMRTVSARPSGSAAYGGSTRTLGIPRPSTGGSSSTGSGGTPYTSADVMEGRLGLGQPATPVGTGVDEDALAAYLAGEPFTVPSVNYGSGSGSSSADRLARTGATNQNAYFQALLAQAPGQYQGLRDLLASQRAEREAAVNAGIEAQRAALTGRYTTAQADVARAYDDLRAALEANAPRAYANLPRATAPELAPDVVSRYAQAVGAPTQSIAEAAVQEAARSAGTGEAYNRLLANLQANEAAQQASRLAGVGMGRTAATGNLTALQQAGLDRIEAQKQAALNQILAEIQQGQFGIAQGQLGYEQGLRQALAGLYGTGYVAPTGV